MNIIRLRSFIDANLFLTPLFLSLAVSAEGKSINKDQVNVRAQPSLTSPILFTAPLGYPIEIKEKKGDWFFLRDWQENDGWVHKSLVSDKNTAVILIEKANIRNDSTQKSRVTSTANQGEVYIILEKKRKWTKLGYFDTNEPVGWIRNDLIFGE